MDIKFFEKSPPKNILIVKLSALGDIVQSLPVLHALSKHFSTSAIHWVTGEVGANLLKDNPLIDKIIVYKRKTLGQYASSPLKWPMLLKELISLRNKLRETHYDLTIDLQGLLKSGVITFFSGASIRLGFDRGRELSHLFLNYKLPPYDPDKHAVLRYLDLLKPLGITLKPNDIKFPIGINNSDILNAIAILKENDLDPKKTICLIPGTIWPSKKWDAKLFSEVSINIEKRFSLKSVVIGSAQDKPLGQEIEALSNGSAIDLTGKTPLKCLAALFSISRAAVSVDTGPMHLAAASGAKIVALFGPTAPWRTGPFGEGHIILRKGLTCSPCFKRSCNDRRCMLDIEVNDVIDALGKIL